VGRQLRAQNSKLLQQAKEPRSSQRDGDYSLCIDDVMMTGDNGIPQEW
jgi:hypothetical protein